jgi:hypothetical protein
MNDRLSTQDLGYLVDSLAPHQRVMLLNVVRDALAACPRGREPLAPEILPLLRNGLAPLFDLLDQLRRYAPNDSDIWPFSFRIPESGNGLITVFSRFSTWSKIGEAESYEWIDHAKLRALSVDISRMNELTSVTVAWLVNLAKRLPQAKLALKGANSTAKQVVNNLCLQQMLVCA